MRIATYNVNGINARLPVLLRWLEEYKPDVVCLQELKAPDEKIPKSELKKAGYQAIWHGQKQWNGVAILSKEKKITERRRELPGDPEDLQSRYLEVEIDGIIIVGMYLPNGNPAPGPKYDYKLDWFSRFTKHASELIKLKKPVLLTGDFNVIPTELDAYKAERWVKDALFLPETRKAFFNLKDQGWTDALRELYPEKVIYTYWDYFRNAYQRNAGLRIDHFLLSPELLPQLQAAEVDREVRGWKKSSDHAPVWIKLE